VSLSRGGSPQPIRDERDDALVLARQGGQLTGEDVSDTRTRDRPSTFYLCPSAAERWGLKEHMPKVFTRVGSGPDQFRAMVFDHRARSCGRGPERARADLFPSGWGAARRPREIWAR